MKNFLASLRKLIIVAVLLFSLPVFAQDANDLYDQAWNSYQEEDYPKALNLVNKAIAKDKNRVAYYQVKAYIQIAMKAKPSEVIETANAGLKLDNDNADLTEMRGTSYYFDFKHDLALQDFRRMIELKNDDARYFNNYFKLLNELRYDEELMSKSKIFEDAVEDGVIDKTERYVGDSYFYPALAFGRDGNYKKAVELLDKAIDYAPDAEMYYNNRGLYYLELKEDKKALADLTKAIELDPENEEYYVNRNIAFFRMNDHVSGRNDLLKALALGSNDAGVYADLAMSYLIDNDHKKAAEMYEAYFKKVNNNPTAFGNYAYTVLEFGEVDKAKTYFEKAQAIEPEEIDFYLGMMAVAKLKNDNTLLEKMKSEFPGKFTQYKLSAKLLDQLEKEGYSYTDSFKKKWKEVFK